MPASDYSFDQQQKDFIKLQFRYAALLKAKLANGDITQAYYDNNIWLTQQQLQAPPGFWTEFGQAIEDVTTSPIDSFNSGVQWLAQITGESTESIANYLGTVAAKVVKGAVEGVATNLGFSGWIFVLLILLVLIWAFAKGPLSEVKIKTVPV